IVAFGPGYVSIIAMGAMISIIITTLVVYSAFKEVDPNYVKVLQSFGATRWQWFKEAIFPATLPTMISTLKVNVDRKSTRLNSSHVAISYAVFCLKKKIQQ